MLFRSGTIRISVGKGKETTNGFVWTEHYSPDVIIKQLIEHKYGKSQEVRDFIDGIIEGVKAIASGTGAWSGKVNKGDVHLGMGLGEALARAVEQSNLMVAELWDDFNKNYTGPNKNSQFMKHAIIGGYIASQMGSMLCELFRTHNLGKMKREIGFATSYMYEIFQRLNPGIKLNIHGYDGKMDLVGIANLMLAMFIEEWRARFDSPEFIRIKDGTINDVGNISGGANWKANFTGSGAAYFNNMFTADGYDKTKSSRFMNIMASMAVFFSKTELVKTYQRHESLNSVTFWLEAARRYNGGNEIGRAHV